MAINVIDNFSYRGKKPNFDRDSFDTLSAMKSFPETDIDEGHISFCKEDGKHYKFSSANEVDPTTGKWREDKKLPDNIVLSEPSTEIPSIADVVLGNILTKVEQELTPKEQQQVQKNIAPGGYIRKWLTSFPGVTYNPDTQLYSLNGYNDIDEDEMISIALYCNLNNGNPFEGKIFYNPHRTNIPYYIDNNSTFPIFTTNSFCIESQIEKIVLGAVCSYVDSSSFQNCRKVKSISRYSDGSHNLKFADIYINTNLSAAFRNFNALEDVRVSNINTNCRIFSESPLINYESMKWLIEHRKGTSGQYNPITLTINPTTYSYLTGTAEPTAQVGGTTEEWQVLAQEAADTYKISFATA